ncbi:glycoside hydrolase family 127 protein [Balneolales bacterium ANBcel1]|nr:glycoside hydrolase family 127 protein [Balneolales bacterium ANBcel1]
MIKVFLYTTIYLLFVQFSVSGQHFAENEQIGKVHAFSNADVTLKPAWIEEREKLNKQYISSLDPDRLLHNFRVNAGLSSDAKPLEGWESPDIGLKGHFVGHYVSAAAMIVESHADSNLAERIEYMVAELHECQQIFGNGYLSAFPEEDFDRLEAEFGGVWAPYYTYHKIMQGLLDVYTRLGNTLAYDMVVDMAGYVDQRMSKLDESTIEGVLYSVGANPANEAGAMNEVLYRLYNISGDSAHLDLAKLFDRDWFAVPLAENTNILNGLHSNTHVVLINGFTERYAITGEKKYHDAAMNFWEMLMNDHTYVNGTSSGPRPNAVTPTSLTAEHWGVPGQLSNTFTREIGETCVTHNTQKLSAKLFSWTTDPRYADAYMNTFYNAVLAAQSARTGKVVYHLPLGSPREKIFLKENDFHCCNGSSIEAYASLNKGIYFYNDADLWVNLYVPSQVTWKEKGITVSQQGEFPVDSSVIFQVTAGEQTEFGMNLFIPSWAKSVEVFINGELQEKKIEPLSYLEINRVWDDSDEVKLVFDYDFYAKSTPDDTNVVALFYGPSLLAFETDTELILKGTIEEIVGNMKVEGDNSFTLNNGGKTYTLRPLYNIEEESYSVYGTIRNY